MGDTARYSRKFQKELSAGTSALVLLSLLSRSSKPMYGYQIAKRVREFGLAPMAMKQGALYPVLRSLEANGLLTSEVQPSVSGPPRRYYSVTAVGRDALRECSRIWSDTKRFVDSVLSGKEP
jgi:PadR family transcriptional regulator PadR